jgi:chromosomal replication initiator protein
LEELEIIIENNIEKGNSFFLPFCDLKALIIDNFQDCAGKPEIQKKLVKLLELCSEQKIYIALAVDASPASCSYLSGSLRSLLESGLIIEIKKPDLDIKTRYIQGQNEKLGLRLKKEEILYLARLYSEFRQIHGTMLKVWSFKGLKPRDTDFVLSDILKNSGVSGTVSLTPELVLNCVAEHLNLAAADIRGKERSRQVVLARQLTMYLLRELLPVNLSLIGEFMGLNHSSVVYSINKVKEMMKTNKDINKLVTNLKNMCLTKNRRESFVA